MKQTIANIKEYISRKGYACAEGLVENYYLSLLSRPFVILTGYSDTDKSKLAELFAGAVGATVENGRYQCLRVEFDWMDSSDLFGHVNLEGTFIPGAIIDFLNQAHQDPEHPYFLCLDRLILARVEYYLREVLNIIEARESGAEPGLLVPPAYYGPDRAAAEKYGEIPALTNLYIIGTLNLDETSFPLNQKLLDRVHTLEVGKDDLVYTGAVSDATAAELSNDFLQTPYLRLDQCGEYQQGVQMYIGVFEQLNKILMKATAYVGFKLRNDAILYLLNNHRTQVLEETAALDHEITQKVLPRVQGSAKAVAPVLEQLADYCAGRFPKAEKRIWQMLKKCEQDGFTSYWM